MSEREYGAVVAKEAASGKCLLCGSRRVEGGGLRPTNHTLHVHCCDCGWEADIRFEPASVIMAIEFEEVGDE